MRSGILEKHRGLHTASLDDLGSGFNDVSVVEI